MLDRSAANHQVGDAVGVALPRVAVVADAAFELHAAVLLEHVSGLVRCFVEGGVAAGEDRVAVNGVGAGSKRAARGRGAIANVGGHASEIMFAERCLQSLVVRQLAAAAARSVRGHRRQRLHRRAVSDRAL
jgi:hypothetical protein